MSALLSQHQFDTGHVMLNYVKSPNSGPPLILLHGATGWWQSWLPVVSQLALTHQIFAIDMRGSGGSSHPGGAYGVMDMAKDVADFLAKQVQGPVRVLGHSFGGHVALALSGLMPERIETIIFEDIPLLLQDTKLVGKPAGPGFSDSLRVIENSNNFTELVDAVAKLSPQNNPVDNRVRAKTLSLLDPQLIKSYVQGKVFADYNADQLLRQIKVPSLLISADPVEGARILPHEVAHATALAPTITSIMFEKIGHNIHTESPHKFTKTVSDFLLSLP